MSFILKPRNGESLQVNAWNWRPTLELLRDAQLIDERNYELMGAGACGGHVDAATAERIADLIDAVIARMKPGQRVRADLSITAKPKKQVVFTRGANIEVVDLYSATYDWLVTFRDFCRASGGFEVQ